MNNAHVGVLCVSGYISTTWTLRDVPACPIVLGHFGTPIGGLGPMPIASNRSGYERLGGPSTFAVAPLDALCSAIHHSRGRVWFGPRARQSLENVENRFS